MGLHHHSNVDSCSNCPVTSCKSQQEPAAEAMKGVPFALSAVGVFLVPVLLGITGGIYAGGNDVRQFCGATLGLLGGMAITMCVARFLRRNKGED